MTENCSEPQQTSEDSGMRISYKPVLVMFVGWAFTSFLVWIGLRLASRGYGDDVTNTIGIVASIWGSLVLARVILGYKMARDFERINASIANRQQALFPADQVPDRMRVNSSLDKVISSVGTDMEAAREVLIFASKLPINDNWTVRRTLNKDQDKLTGFTEGFGNVEIGSEQEPVFRTESFPKVRVGQYKLWRTMSILFFQNFWASDIETSMDPLDAYRGHALIFDVKTFEPIAFGNLEITTADKSGKIYNLGVRILSGKLPAGYLLHFLVLAGRSA